MVDMAEGVTRKCMVEPVLGEGLEGSAERLPGPSWRFPLCDVQARRGRALRMA